MTLQLANSSVRLPLGIVEDVPVLVGKFYVPVDFVVMEMEEDKNIPIILGRLFFKTARTLIDVEKGTLTLRIGDEKVEFNLNRAMKCPSEPETCCAIDVVDRSAKEQSCKQFGSLFKDYPDYLADPQVQEAVLKSMCAAEAKFDSLKELSRGPDRSHMGRTPQSEGPEGDEQGSDKPDTSASHGPDKTDTDRLQTQTEQPTPEFKPLPANLRYEFPEPNKSCPVILNADLDLDHNLRFKALQMVIRGIVMAAQQTLIGDLIKKVTGTCEFRTLPADHHTGRAPQKWALRPDPPDPPLTSQ